MQIPRGIRERPYTSAAVGILGGAFVLWQLGAFGSTAVEVKAPQRPERVVAATVTSKMTLQGEVESLKSLVGKQEEMQTETLKALQKMQRQQQDVTEAHDKKEARWLETLTQQKSQFQSEIDRLKKERVATTTPAKSAPSRPAPVHAGPPAAPPAPKLFELRTIGSSKDTPRRTIPPVAHQEEMAYLGEASTAHARIVTGVVATARGGSHAPGAEGDIDVMLSITGPFDSAWLLHGPGRNPEPTSLPLQGCRMFGWSRADLSSSRVYVHLHTLVCVMPGRHTFPVRIRGYVTDMDGTVGVVGRYETRNTAIMAKASLSALLQETAALIGLAKSAVVITGQPGGYVQPFQGVQTGIQQITSYLLEQARMLGPVLWVESNTPVQIVMQDGVTLPDYPVVTLLGGQ